MDQTLKALLERGGALLSDTKTPRKSAAKTVTITPAAVGAPETDPYRAFSRRAISEKPKKVELVKEIKNFIASAEADL